MAAVAEQLGEILAAERKRKKVLNNVCRDPENGVVNTYLLPMSEFIEPGEHAYLFPPL